MNRNDCGHERITRTLSGLPLCVDCEQPLMTLHGWVRREIARDKVLAREQAVTILLSVLVLVTVAWPVAGVVLLAALTAWRIAGQ